MCLGAVGARHVVRVVQRGLVVGHHFLREVLVRDLRLGFGVQREKCTFYGPEFGVEFFIFCRVEGLG